MINQFIAILCFLVGAVSGGFFVWSLIKQRRIGRWSFTKGKVFESRLNVVSGDSFEPYVKYSYTVQGRNYSNDKIAPVNYLTEDESAAKKALTAYWVDASIEVFYDPNDPSRSILEWKNSFWTHIFWIVFSTFFIGAGFIALYQNG